MFKRTFQLLVVACVVASGLWAADASFVGAWKLHPSKSELTDEMKVASSGANKYAFDFGYGSPETIVVDGTDQPGNFGTTLSVTVEAPDTWKVVRKKEGRLLLPAAWKLSKDSKTLNDDFTAVEPNGWASTVNYVYTRTAGTSGFSGTWESTSETVNSVYVLQVRTYVRSGPTKGTAFPS